ncbi:hypothetical protein NE237_030915 [Protea cynaroides]|uniref:Pentatricopeptide repeat-containing protein n=1 Tax=Protea cynaroides TaxID=273540 RepID=A0A9Q0GWU6_9MAGN|nr:hypothetical protein NE237_030915 [Protea cynaroides]
MSKTLFFRIKPSHNPKPPLNSHYETRISKLVEDVSEILRTHEQYDESLETRFSEEDLLVSEAASLVLNRIRDAELGVKFFDWVSRRPWSSPDSRCYSSLLKVLAHSKLFSEIETLLENMRNEDKLPTHESLNVLIRAYADSGFVDKALEFYSVIVKMHDSFPNVFTCNSLLNLLVKHRRIDVARQIYDEMLQRNNCEHSSADNYSTCIMVRGLCREGQVEAGRKLIEDRWGKGCIPNVVFYNTLIDGYCKKGDVQRAYGIFREMKLKGFLPTLVSYGAIINGFCKQGNFKAIDQLLSEVKTRGLCVNVQIYNNIIDAQCKHGSILQAMETFRKMVGNGCEPDVITYNTMICGYCKEGKVHEAYDLLRQAVNRGLMPNKYSYTPLVHGYSKQGEAVRASNLLIEMMEGGHKPDLVTYGALIHGLVLAGEVNVALTIRDKMIERGVFPDSGIYNVLMSGLCKKGLFPATKQLLEEMLYHKITPDAFVYTTIIDGFIRHGDIDEAKKLFNLLIENCDPGLVGYNTMIKGYCKFGMMKDAISCIGRMRERHIFPDAFTYSTIVDGYVKQDDMDGALRAFRNMMQQRCKPNVVTYSSLINGFCRKGESHRAVGLFREMQSCGLTPNVVTYSVLIGHFCKDGKLGKAASFFEEMLINKCTPNDITYHYLIKGLMKNISEEDVFQEHPKSLVLNLFERMISDRWDPRTAANNAILICLCQHGMLKNALELRDKWLGKGYLLDPVTFTALLRGVCIEGRSREWNNILSCNLNQRERQVALDYSLLLDQYLPHGVISEASQILQFLVEECKADNQKLSKEEVNGLKISVI